MKTLIVRAESVAWRYVVRVGEAVIEIDDATLVRLPHRINWVAGFDSRRLHSPFPFSRHSLAPARAADIGWFPRPARLR